MLRHDLVHSSLRVVRAVAVGWSLSCRAVRRGRTQRRSRSGRRRGCIETSIADFGTARVCALLGNAIRLPSRPAWIQSRRPETGPTVDGVAVRPARATKTSHIGAGAGRFGRMINTGQVAWWAIWLDTEPSNSVVKPP